MTWEPTVGKWNDEKNYQMKEPLWKSMLKTAAKYGDITELQELLLWLYNRNMLGDSFRTQIIGYHLCKIGVDLENELAFSNQIASDMYDFSKQFATVDECAIYMMKKHDISEEIIDEFRNR